MKKLVIGLVLFTNIITAQAANWQYQGTHTNDVKSYIDIDSLVFTDNSRRSRTAWLKMVSPSGGFLLSRVEIDCPTRMMRYLADYWYSPAGNLYDSTTNPGKWDYTVPNSYAERWSNVICLTNVPSR